MTPNKKNSLGDYFTSSKEKGLEGLPLLSVTLHDGVIQRNALDRRTDTNIASEKHLLAREGDIVYNMMRVWQGALGRVKSDGLVSPAYVVLRATAGVDSLYAEYLFKSAKMIYLFWAYSYGITSDRLRLYFADFKKIPVNFPRITEQKKIAKILSTWDKAISVTESLILNSEQVRSSLMHNFFTQKKSPLGSKINFTSYRFSDLLLIDQKNLSSNTPNEYQFKYISLSDIKNGKISKNLPIYTFGNAPSRARRIIAEGDILFSTVRPNLKGFSIVSPNESGYIASTGFSVLSPKASTHNEYIYYYLFSEHISSQISALVVGTNYPAINSSDISNLKIYCPPYEDQLEIAKILDNNNKIITALEKKVNYLRQEKKSLMQQLLTGKLRVKVEIEQ